MQKMDDMESQAAEIATTLMGVAARTAPKTRGEDSVTIAKVEGRDLERLVKLPMIYTLIRMAHGPAHLAGFGALHDFLEDGFRAFRAMRGAEEFLQAIEDRETRIMERIFAEHPQPFRLAEDGEAPPEETPA